MEKYKKQEKIIQLVVHQIILKYKKKIAIYLSEQQALDADSKADQQTNFTENLRIAENTKMFLTLEEVKKHFLDFQKKL